MNIIKSEVQVNKELINSVQGLCRHGANRNSGEILSKPTLLNQILMEEVFSVVQIVARNETSETSFVVIYYIQSMMQARYIGKAGGGGGTIKCLLNHHY